MKKALKVLALVLAMATPAMATAPLWYVYPSTTNKTTAQLSGQFLFYASTSAPAPSIILQGNGGRGTFAQGVTASSFSATGVGVLAPRWNLNGTVYVSSESSTALGAGVRVSSNVYIVGFSSAAQHYGGGAGLTSLTPANISAGSLGNSVIASSIAANANLTGKTTLSTTTISGSLTLNNSSATINGAYGSYVLSNDNISTFDSYSSNTGHTPYLQFRKSQQNTVGYVPGSNLSYLGVLEWYGVNAGATNWARAAVVRVLQEGSSGTTYNPAKIMFMLSDGTANQTETLTLHANHNIVFSEGQAKASTFTATTGNLDLAGNFTAQGNGTGAFYVAGSSVGIGVAPTTAVLDLKDPRTSSYANPAFGQSSLRVNKENSSGSGLEFGAVTLNASSNGGTTNASVQLNVVQEANASTAGSFTVKTRNGSGDMNEWMRINSSGYTGLGTLAPSFPLDVQLASTNSSMVHIGTGAVGGIYIDSTSPSNGGVRFGAYLAGGANVAASATPASIINVAGEMRFRTDTGATPGAGYTPTNRLIIQSDGDVGIGVDAPAYKLEVAGIAKSSQVIAAAATPDSDVYAPTSSFPWLVIQESNVNSSAFVGYDNTAAGPYMNLMKTRSTSPTADANTIVQVNDNMGGLLWRGADGAAYITSAAIRAQVDGTPGASDMPGRITFETTPDGSATRIERMRISNGGFVTFASSVSIGEPLLGTPAIAPALPLVVTSTAGASSTIYRTAKLQTSAPGSDSSGACWGFASSTTDGYESQICGGRVSAGNNWLSLRTGSNNPQHRLYIDNAGNIGVGTISPTDTLQVVGSFRASSITIPGAGLTITSASVSGMQGGITFQEPPNISDTRKMWIGITPDPLQDLTIRRLYAGNFYDMVTFNRTSGNVGISTTAPVGKLTIGLTAGASPSGYALKISSDTTNEHIFGLHNDGHMSIGGTVPTLGTCTNGTLSANSHDLSGGVEFSGANSSCAIVFGKAMDAEPFCVLTLRTASPGPMPVQSTATASGFTIVPNSGAFAGGDRINWWCPEAHE